MKANIQNDNNITKSKMSFQNFDLNKKTVLLPRLFSNNYLGALGDGNLQKSFTEKKS